jgi:hypothetical protein
MPAEDHPRSFMYHEHRVKRRLTIIFLALFSMTVAARAGMPLPSPDATSSITAGDLRKHLSFLASDELGGRYTFSQGNRIAARYLASQLESYGYRGAARDGSFFQRVPLSYRSVEASTSRVALGAGGAKQVFKYGSGFLVTTPADVNVAGEVVFVGYGISAPRINHDDYAGLDVKGKIVVAVNGQPNSIRKLIVTESEQGEQAALAHQAAALITVTPDALLTWEQTKSYLSSLQNLGLPPHATASGKVFPAISAGPELIRAIARALGKEDSYLFTSAGKPLSPSVMPVTAEIKMKVEVKDAPLAQNVVGVLEGADPKLKQEYVVFSAHYDHLNTDDAGAIYNGADDDGSGTVSVLEIAQAFTVGARPKRSILVIFHTGEELGLFGSEFNADYEPVVPLGNIVADFNIDMVGRSRPPGDVDPRDSQLTDKDSVYIIGADKVSTEFHNLNVQTNLETARLRFDYTYNDERHPERFYYRSDHYNYGKHGIPIVFYFTGVHRDYHRPTDDVDKIDFEKMERIDRMIFATGWRVVNLDHRPAIDKRPAADASAQ